MPEFRFRSKDTTKESKVHVQHRKGDEMKLLEKAKNCPNRPGEDYPVIFSHARTISDIR